MFKTKRSPRDVRIDDASHAYDLAQMTVCAAAEMVVIVSQDVPSEANDAWRKTSMEQLVEAVGELTVAREALSRSIR